MNFYKLNDLFKDVTINSVDWDVADIRIDIPELSLGSDGINPHTQYSNPTCHVVIKGIECCGIGFTLGSGNELVCSAIKTILAQLNNISIAELLVLRGSIQRVFSNPKQLRWLGPNSGCVYMAGSVILNTLLDFAAKRAGMPLWELLSISRTEDLLQWVDNIGYSNLLSCSTMQKCLDKDIAAIEDRIQELRYQHLPVYHTTWIGSSPQELVEEMDLCYQSKGVNIFKLKLPNDLEWSKSRLHDISRLDVSSYRICVDTNQTLSLETAREILPVLDTYKVLWLEEPFAPDNTQLYRVLYEHIKLENFSTKISTGENCPNAHVAVDLIANEGCHIFQPDACRVMSICDNIPILISAYYHGRPIIPHAGGSGLDELVPHLQSFNLCRIDHRTDISNSLMENVGFCSHLFDYPTLVKSGRVDPPKHFGYVGGFNYTKFDSTISGEGTIWLKL
ncbi:enolase C-terminal domain-like protein [Cylindrospermopsis raciborskii DSH]|uniref:enolase C-terminal domain-like protein n=1 Tax=Cylindrospermopsis raciborskii TaxID=77022 RepID=UPI002EDA55D0